MIKDKKTVKEMIDSLRSIYERKCVASQLLLRKQLLVLRYNESDEMSRHFIVFDQLYIKYWMSPIKESRVNVNVGAATMNVADITWHNCNKKGYYKCRQGKGKFSQRNKTSFNGSSNKKQKYVKSKSENANTASTGERGDRKMDRRSNRILELVHSMRTDEAKRT